MIPGRAYRREAVTLTHNDIFHQMECLVIGPGISFGDLKGVMTAFVHEFFGPKTQVRFRPDYFPFTEPSADFSVTRPLWRRGLPLLQALRLGRNRRLRSSPPERPARRRLRPRPRQRLRLRLRHRPPRPAPL